MDKADAIHYQWKLLLLDDRPVDSRELNDHWLCLEMSTIIVTATYINITMYINIGVSYESAVVG